jgi:hypothetical protein
VTARRAALAAIVLLIALLGARLLLLAEHHRAKPELLYVAPRGDNAGRCTSSQPCASFQRALEVASREAEVLVAGGRYPAQTLTVRRGDGAPPVTIRPASEAPVRLDGQLTISSRRLEVRDMEVGGWMATPAASHVVLRDIRSHAGMFITSASDISVIGGSVGPGSDYSPEIKAAQGSSRPPRRILIDGVTFHDWVRTRPDSHVDCLHVMAVDGLVIRRSSFANCEAFAILFTEFGNAGSPRNVTVQDNRMSCCRSGYYALLLGGNGRYRNFLISGNSTNSSLSVAPGTTDSGANIRFVRNRSTAPFNPLLCDMPGVSWHDNRWADGVPCAAGGPAAPAPGAAPTAAGRQSAAPAYS